MIKMGLISYMINKYQIIYPFKLKILISIVFIIIKHFRIKFKRSLWRSFF